MSERPRSDRPQDEPSTWPLWVAGLAALAIGAAAFVLWGFGSVGYLIDLVIAFCA